MIPTHDYAENKDLKADFSYKEQPSLTYRIMTEDKRISGNCTGLEAIKQAVYKIIFTERYENVIYSSKYGIELADLLGKPVSDVKSELPRRITDALLQDDRITDVTDFEVIKDTVKRNALHVQFTVISTEGTFEAARTVNY